MRYVCCIKLSCITIRHHHDQLIRNNFSSDSSCTYIRGQRRAYVRVAPQRDIDWTHLAQYGVLPILDPGHEHWLIRRPNGRLDWLCWVDRGGDEWETGSDEKDVPVEHGVVVLLSRASVCVVFGMETFGSDDTDPLQGIRAKCTVGEASSMRKGASQTRGCDSNKSQGEIATRQVTCIENQPWHCGYRSRVIVI